MPGPKRKLRRSSAAVATSREGHRTSSFHPVWNGIGYVLSGATLLASQEENEWPREDETNPFAQPERTGIVCVHQKSQRQAGAKVEPDRRTAAPDSRAHAVFCRRRHQRRRPPLAKIRPGRPVPAMGSGTGVIAATPGLASPRDRERFTAISILSTRCASELSALPPNPELPL